MKMRKITAMLLCVIMLLALAACSTSGGNTNPTAAPGSDSANSTPAGDQTAPVKDTLTLVASNDTGTLAHENVSGDMFYAVQLINEPLWGQTNTTTALDDVFFILAESVEVKSPTEWIIHLKKDIKFSNGNPFTASDVIFSIRKVQESKLNGASRGQLMNMDKSTVIDDYTINFVWDSFHIGQWGIVADCMMYDEESYNAEEVSLNPIGTGPYTVKEYVVNSHLFLERRDDYWGDQPDFKYINFRIMKEASQINNALETGMVDIAPKIANADVEHISSLPGMNVISKYDTNYARVGYNASPASIMHNIEARYAVCHAIDRQAIVNVVYNGFAEVLKRPTCKTCIDNEDRFDNLHETYSIGYDLELAKQYAESSGLSGKTVRLMTNGTPDFVLMAEMIQDMLKEINVTVEIVSYDPATFTSLQRDDVNAEAWDINIAQGINPGYRVASMAIMGVRTAKVYSTPGHWEGVEEFLPKSYSFFETQDDQERSDLTYWIMDTFVDQALIYGICDIETSTAISKSIDPDSLIYRLNGGLFIYLIKRAA